MLNLLVGCLNLGLVMGHSSGAGTCESSEPDGMPGYSTSATTWTLTGPTAGITGGDTVTLTLGGGLGTVQYKGISLYCEDTDSGDRIGSFSYPSSSFQSNYNCGGGYEGLTHTSGAVKTQTTFNWTAPAVTAAINVICRGLAFDDQSQWHPGMSTAAFAVATAPPTTATPTTVAPTTSPTTGAPTTSPTTPAPSTESPTATPTTSAPTASPTTPAPTTSPTTGAPTTSAPTAAPTTTAPTATPTAAVTNSAVYAGVSVAVCALALTVMMA